MVLAHPRHVELKMWDISGKWCMVSGKWCVGTISKLFPYKRLALCFFRMVENSGLANNTGYLAIF